MTPPLHPTPVPTTLPPLPPVPMPAVPAMPMPPAPMPMPMPPPHPHLAHPPAPFVGVPVHEVWADNFHDVEAAIGYFAAHARVVAVDLHYPGVVHVGSDNHDQLLATTTAEQEQEQQRYATVKANVDALKPLQLGLAVCTDAGHVAAWEFNLAGFDPAADAHAAGSVAYLRRRGLRCDDLRARGVPVPRLTRALRVMASRPGVAWVAHTAAYHVAYLMKIVSGGSPLPGDVAGFMAAVRRSLGEEVYDVATMAADCPGIMPTAGLEAVASTLGVAPPLSMHPLAGAGSVLALGAFIGLRSHVFGGNIYRYRGLLKGLQAA